MTAKIALKTWIACNSAIYEPIWLKFKLYV